MIWEIDDNQQKQIAGLDADGRPDPVYAAALGLLPAPLGRRSLAMLLDIVVLTMLQLPLWLGALPLLLKFASGSISAYGLVNHPRFVLAVVTAAISVVLTLVYGIVQLVLHGRKGVTVGKAFGGIRTVDARTLERPGVGAVLLRFLLVVGAGIIPLFGPALFLLSPIFDTEKRGRGWHDLATKVWLVDVRRGLNPYDEKRMRVARKMVVAEPVAERAVLPSLATAVEPGAQPEYRPGSRVSAGVLGVARPHDARQRPEVGLPAAAAPAPVGPVGIGKPVLGGYRNLASDGETPAVPPAPIAPASPPAPGAQAAAPAVQAPAPVAQTPAAPVPAPATPPVTVAVPPKAAIPASEIDVAASPVSVPAASGPAVLPVLGLLLDTGERIAVAEPVLLGRNPDAVAHAGARPIPMADDSRSLSKTHLLVRPVAGGLEIVDCRSTNGSGLIRAGVEYSVAADVPVLTIEGDQIRLGDRIASVVRG